MELIETDAEILPFGQLRLCPVCYLVSFRDEDGVHLRQGIPVRNVTHPSPLIN